MRETFKKWSAGFIATSQNSQSVQPRRSQSALRLRINPPYRAWAVEGAFDAATSCAPPKSGGTILIPEAGRAERFALPEAQRPCLDRLQEALTVP